MSQGFFSGQTSGHKNMQDGRINEVGVRHGSTVVRRIFYHCQAIPEQTLLAQQNQLVIS